MRQNFSPADLGENKAKILAERYAAVFGMEAEYLPAFVEDLDTLTTLIHADGWAGEYSRYPTVREQVILIGAVDNDKSRQLCHKAFLKAETLSISTAAMVSFPVRWYAVSAGMAVPSESRWAAYSQSC